MQIRVILNDGKNTGLYFWATKQDLNFYYGSANTDLGEILRGSYHESGKSHIHLPGGRYVGHIQLPPPRSLDKPLRLTEQSTDLSLIKWQYKIKEEIDRKNVIIDFTDKNSNWLPSVEFWMIPSKLGHQAVASIISKRKGYGDQLLGEALIKETSPRMLALVWMPSDKVKKAFEKSLNKTSN